MFVISLLCSTDGEKTTAAFKLLQNKLMGLKRKGELTQGEKHVVTCP